MSSPPTWQDRRGMFQPGKHVHEPSKPVQVVKKAIGLDTKTDAAKSPTSPTNPTPTSATDGSGAAARRRSSASSQGGVFSGLMARRTSADYSQRRASWDEMKKDEGGIGGFLGGLINKK